MFGLSNEDSDEDKGADKEQAKEEAARTAAKIEQASGELFRTAPPGVPTVKQLDERLKAVPENQADKNAERKETVALIDKALGMVEKNEGAPTAPIPATPRGAAEVPVPGQKIRVNSSKFDHRKIPTPLKAPPTPQSGPKIGAATVADGGHDDHHQDPEVRPRRPKAPVTGPLIRPARRKTAGLDELGL